MKLITIATIAITAVVWTGTAYGQQPAGNAKIPAPSEFIESQKRLADFLSDGWDFKSGEITPTGRLEIWLTKGRRIACCILDDNQKTKTISSLGCIETPN